MIDDFVHERVRAHPHTDNKKVKSQTQRIPLDFTQ